jgi:CRP-like cAMP-binding protein
MVDEELRKLLQDEAGGVEMSDELFTRLIDATTEIKLKNKEVLIAIGQLDTNVYIQKSGIMRACYLDGGNEYTYGFSAPGTVVISYHSYFMHLPSVFQIESCGKSVVLKISKMKMNEIVKSSNEFAEWLLAIHSAQLFSNEFKIANITGNAKDRYRSYIKNRPEIVAGVPAKLIASYLGISTVHLSRLKKSI